MGKASRRKGAHKKPARVPFAAKPFDGLASETSWVALREILPAATARLSFTYDGAEHTATVATVLPLAWAGLCRNDGERFIATQSGAGSGDLSRDLAAALVATVEAEPGTPVPKTPPVTVDTPRLQDLLSDRPLELELHDGFDFWLQQDDLDDAAESSVASSASAPGLADTSPGSSPRSALEASLEQANAAISPTEPLPAAESAYWCRIGGRTYVRWVLPHAEDEATAALARLHAAGRDSLVGVPGEGRLLGAFRTCGLLVPVWEVDASAEAASYNTAMGELASRFEQALASVRAGEALTDTERRARAGLVSRQITIR